MKTNLLEIVNLANDIDERRAVEVVQAILRRYWVRLPEEAPAPAIRYRSAA